jgi:hypothetical protein
MTLKSHIVKDTKWSLKHNAIYAGAKEFIIGCCGRQGANMLAGAAAFLAGDPSHLLALIGVAAIGAVSAGLTILRSNEKLDDLAEDYAEEVGKKLMKDPKRVTRHDLEIVAKGDPARGIEPNHVLAEKLSKEKRSLAVGVVISVVATLAALWLAPALVGALPMLAPIMHSAPLAHVLINGFAGVLMYHAAKTPLHSVADNLFHIDEKTTVDHIRDLGKQVHKGKHVSQEQVLGIYVSADKKLAQFIQDRFGVPYDELSDEGKKQAVTLMSRHLPLESVTSAINNKHICVTELAFLTQNDRSGVSAGEWHDRPTTLSEQVMRGANKAYDTVTLGDHNILRDHGLSYVDREHDRGKGTAPTR